MSTREEIDAAVKRIENDDYHQGHWYNIPKKGEDRMILADAYLAERQQRERDQQPPTREMFERLGAVRHPWGLSRGLIEWGDACDHPLVYFTSPQRDADVDLDTIAKLRAACLLLGINTEGIL